MNLALFIFLTSALLGFVLLVGGVYLLAGIAWALITGSLSMFCIAGFIKRGMSNG